MRTALLLAAPAVALALPQIVPRRHLIETAPNVREWVPAVPEKENALGVGFFDLTSLHERDELHLLEESNFVAQDYAAVVPDAPRQTSQIKTIINYLSVPLLNETVSTLAAYKTRNYQSAEAVEASNWLLGRFEAVGRSAGRLGADASVRLFPHSWKQPSVIATIKGSLYPNEIIVLGAHVDSTSGSTSSTTARAPGADDDASGVANLLDIYQAIMKAGYRPKRTIEFMAYAAEEVGLRGSLDIATQYNKDSKNVVASYMLEMSGYTNKAEGKQALTVLTDYVNTPLTNFLVTLAPLHLENITVLKDKCGYGCSDHASWDKFKYPALCVAEAGPNDKGLNPNYHSANDLPEKLNYKYMSQFSRLGLALAVEVSEYTQ